MRDNFLRPAFSCQAGGYKIGETLLTKRIPPASPTTRIKSSADQEVGATMTGPRTPQGKKRSSRNALKHGIFSKEAVIEGEPRREFDSLLKGLQETLQPVGALEHLLVEKLAVLSWRYRRVVIAEGAEIRKSVDFYKWDRDLDRERSLDTKLPMAKFAGGLIKHLNTREIIERCLELLEELRCGVERRGFDPERDRNVLTTLYGTDLENQSRHSLLRTYAGCVVTAKEATDDEVQQDGHEQAERGREENQISISAGDCKDFFLREVESQIRWLRRCRKQFGAVEADRMTLERLSRRIPDAATSDRLLRYEASLERSFDRTLGQLERLQRMRLGQAVLPPVRVELSG